MIYRKSRGDESALFYRQLIKHRLKITPQRALIYEALLKSKNHPTADDVFQKVVERIPNISFDTVNRTLLTFSKIGLTSVVEGYGQPKRYDTDMDSHHHFRCIQCGDIIDFHNAVYDSLTIPGEIIRRHVVIRHKVVIEGLCAGCKKTRT
jgi:Fur family peroxide stress response transcriptional regulator